LQRASGLIGLRFLPVVRLGQMRRTLLAVGFAVLVSMMLAPHGDYEHGRHTQIKGFGPFFSDYGFIAARTGYGCSKLWIGSGSCYAEAGRIMIDMLALEIVFLAVLFAVVVNIPWRRRQK
jgi:hypothetical protein